MVSKRAHMLGSHEMLKMIMTNNFMIGLTSRGSTKIKQSRKTVAELPKMKSTVPNMQQDLHLDAGHIHPYHPKYSGLLFLMRSQLVYQHFDTATFYGTEYLLGKALNEAVALGLVKSRHELFITTKIWITDCQEERFVPALHESLRLVQKDYVDLYLIHWPVSLINEPPSFNIMHDFNKENLRALDIKSVWKAMEECTSLGLAKSIGVSNFSCKKLEQLLEIAVIPPAVNQVELNPVWQQKRLVEFCKQKGIQVVAYSPLGANGAPWEALESWIAMY